MGRIDLYDRWQGIKARWLEHYLNNEVHTGESVTAFVTDNDEWVAEAYLETDYSKITRADFEQVVREFALFQLLGAEVGRLKIWIMKAMKTMTITTSETMNNG